MIYDPKETKAVENSAAEIKAAESKPEPYVVKSLERVKRRPVWPRVVGIVVMLIAVIAGLAFVPWQQTIEGNGQVIIFSAMDRPQSVASPIPARIVEWKVQEGDLVKAGDEILRIEDVDSKFLDPNLVKRLTQQRDFSLQAQRETETRVTALQAQKSELESSRVNAIGAARQAVQQSRQRLKAAAEQVRQAEKSLDIARQVARQGATERANQQQDRLVQAEQALTAANQQLTTMQLRYDRIKDLEGKGLRSRQDLEFADNDLVKARTDVERAKKSLEIAKRDVKLGTLGETQADLEVQRAQSVVDQVRANFAVAERDVTNAELNLNRVQYDTAAGLSRLDADVQSARETLAKNGSELQKVENELANLEQRTQQQVIRAPAGGRIARLTTVGAGAIVKSGDELAVIVPTTPERAVELFVTDTDVPLVEVGKPVRLQFAGWPALQFPGWQGAAIGTFGGKVAIIDPVDDGNSRYRVVVVPDRQTLLTGKLDEPWPSSELLRPGAEAYGWVMLGRVPLGFELWRQFNGFPASVPRQRLIQKKGTNVAPGKEEKEKPDLGPIKVKTK
ncbi:MAG: HlyD family efflux transporter periplasmic adaptor subunit [Fimbriimonadaceae bacterium]|nr:HlyD family efflux transporter periplasmic adaptor subunit [Fimbriimonadaceae bacterium]